MAIVTTDIIDGASGIKDSSGWKNLTRVIIVENVTGDDILAKGDAAIATAGISYGDIHPSDDSGSSCRLREIQVDPARDDDNGIIKLTCKYSRHSEEFEENLEEMGASVVQVEASRDNTGSTMTIGPYTYPVGYQRSPHDAPLESEVTVPKVTHTASKMAPQDTWSKTKKESYSTLKSQVDTYVGKVNSTTWRGYAEKEWLCTAIRGRSSDGGYSYEVAYEFLRRRDTWDEEVVFVQDNGKTPNPLVPGESYEVYELYSEADFNNLVT